MVKCFLNCFRILVEMYFLSFLFLVNSYDGSPDCFVIHLSYILQISVSLNVLLYFGAEMATFCIKHIENRKIFF